MNLERATGLYTQRKKIHWRPEFSINLPYRAVFYKLLSEDHWWSVVIRRNIIQSIQRHTTRNKNNSNKIYCAMLGVLD
jgi:hypothetical protein